jgi:signal peptidase I
MMRIMKWKPFRWTHRLGSKSTKRPGPRSGFVLLWLAVGCTLSFLFASHFVYSTMQVVGFSMHPTLINGDRRIVNHWWYHAFKIERGDLALVREPNTQSKVVKRIIAVPGDTVFIDGRVVHVNGHPLHEPYVPRGTHTSSPTHATTPLLLSQNQFFVMGDNRSHSHDSRSYGPVSRRDILGVVIP